MNNYINTKTLQVHSENDIRNLNPNTSFPLPFIPPEDYVLVFDVPKPLHNEITQTVQQTAPVLTAKGHYEQTWKILELFSKAIDRTNALASATEAKRKSLVPTFVSPRQIRQALSRIELRNAVEAAVAQGDQDLKDWWEFSTNFERVNSQVQAMGTALGVNDLQLDDLWTLAGSL